MQFIPAGVELDSATESESDSELPADRVSVPISKYPTFATYTLRVHYRQRLKPRPGFRLGPGQTPLGAFVLDREQRIMIPAAINTYLREYQRDGVLFFWNQYKKG
jgi:hypothetical protein